MRKVNRWWRRNRWAVPVGALVLVIAFSLRGVQGGPLRTVYRWLTQPFAPNAKELQAYVDQQTQTIQAQLQALEQENQTLETLLKQPEIKTQKAIAAAVMGRSSDLWWQTLHLNQGAKANVKMDAVVISTGGLVGRVVKTFPDTSTVMLVSDPTSRLAVTISRSRSIGIIQGMGKNEGLVEFFEANPDVKPGDLVTTSELSCFFPANIPVGKVKSIDASKKNVFQATVEFSAPLARLEWVSIYQNVQRPQTKTTTSAGCP
jgi:rod shape-determining protein MreC